jgi:lipopolysaccharide export system protein LptA
VKRFALFAVCLLSLYFHASADDFSFQAEKMSSVVAKGKERTVLTGKARIESDSTLITADRIEMYGKDYRFAVCTGSVIVIDEKNQIKLTSETLTYDRTEKISRIEGPSVMEDKKNKIVIKGSFLENNDSTETTVIQIGVRILKEDMACRSEFAFYRRKENVLELSGMPSVYWQGDEYKASKITVNIDTDEIKLEGEVQGTIKRKDEPKKTEPSLEGQDGKANPPDGKPAGQPTEVGPENPGPGKGPN